MTDGKLILIGTPNPGSELSQTTKKAISYKVCGVCDAQLVRGICKECGWADGDPVWVGKITVKDRES